MDLSQRASRVMLGSTVINQRQHVGLQKLSVLAGITHSSLGPNKTYKFIHNEASRESSLVCSCFRILQTLELTCAVGQLVSETVQVHQKVYHSGSACLLFLAGAWSRAALECFQRGIPVTHIISAMSQGMDICLDVCRKCSISTQGLCSEPKNHTVTSKGLDLVLLKKPAVEASQVSSHLRGTIGVRTSGQKINLRHSRHFCEAELGNVSAVLQEHSPKSEQADVAHIAEALSHGCVNAMNLVVEAGRMQSKYNEQDSNCFTFDVTKVVTCVLPGVPEDSACVLPGCIVLVSTEQALTAQYLKEQNLTVALINGDLSHTYRHLGFKRLTGVQCVSDHVDSSSLSKEEEWMENVMMFLLKLKVNLILVSGFTNEKLIQCCCRHHILVVDKVKVSVLKAFAAASGAVPVSYATQLSRHCVGTGLNVVVWRDLSNSERKSLAAVNISTAGNSGLVTAIITSSVHGKLQALQDEFWACAYRLHHALKDGALLPGAGATEVLCIHHLQKQANRHFENCKEKNSNCTHRTRKATNPFTGVVLNLMADSLIDYISTVMANAGTFSKVRARTEVCQQLRNCDENVGITTKFSQLFLEGETGDSEISSAVKFDEAPAEKVYDNVSVKQEAWRKALDLVFLVLQTDAEVITGVDQKTDGTQTDLMFL
ncbi:hypothetical protein LDENG_00146670 [Lucifuga dentata]|nr:hypothetical protein LDENG_00146670 [Lucifuga dentata]